MDISKAFKNIDNKLWKGGVANALDYMEQSSWILFLKYLSDQEENRLFEAELEGKDYQPVFQKQYLWKQWACKRDKDGKRNNTDDLTGDDLLAFVNDKLFPYLKSFQTGTENTHTIENKIGQVFTRLDNKIDDGYILRDVLDTVDQLEFGTEDEHHQFSKLYEERIAQMGNAGRSGGQYYTPRPLIKVIVDVVNPKIGETVYDPAAGSCGFLVEAYRHIKENSGELKTKQLEKLELHTLYGKEKIVLPYITGLMNMILFGIRTPNLVRKNTLQESMFNVQDKDRHDVIVANPPFGGEETAEIKQNFNFKTSETAYMFLEHFMKLLKKGGRAGIVIKNTFLSNTDNASVALREELLKTCNLHSILVLPQGAFTGAGVKTVILFFDKGKATQKIWYYELNLDRKLGKTNPLNAKDLSEFIELQKNKADSDNSWTVFIDDIDKETWDLSPINPNVEDTSEKRSPSEILAEIEILDSEAAEAMAAIKELL